MKVAKFLFAGMILIASVVVQAAPIDNVTSSAFMPGDSAIFNLDFVDPFGLPFINVTVNTRWTNINQVRSIPMTHAGQDPHYLTTYVGSAIFDTPSSVLEFYGRAEADTIVATQSFKNSTNQFPPDSILYARLAPDPVGDTTPGSAGPFLDLTGSAITYSDTKIFAELNNAGGGWPRNQGLTTYYIYGFFLTDPDTITLSATAMLYSNIPIILPAGLYHVNLADTSFSRLGDIQSQTSGNSLFMSCNIADLLTDPNWHTWPPQAGFIAVGALTLTVSLSNQQFNDYTYPSIFMPKTQSLQVSPNAAPVVSTGGIDIIPGVSIIPRCYYFDADNNLPVTRLLFFDQIEYEMGSFDHSYNDSDSALFEYALNWNPGMHYFYFRFSDGAATVETAVDSLYVNPTGIDNPALPNTYLLHQNYPNPFNAETRIAFDLSNEAMADLVIYDIAGNQVATVADGRFEAGSHTVIWNGKNDNGLPVASGLYFYKLSIDGVHSDIKKMTLLK